ncbi:MAG TPA: FtsW/RodA/SpoVE family cell cycle protein [Cytophagaceae bacterium]|jgi:cell division protein FtsW|nr:FtsW/RodA/SpoVE family cell cycle protein [Cytophagaceae bacterium]
MNEKLKIWTDKNLKGDPIIWAIIIAFSLFSILVVYSAVGSLAYKKTDGNTEHFLFKHSLLVFLSLVFTWFSHKINYKLYWGISKIALWLSPFLLIYGYFFGSKINETSRTFMIPIINQSFQPSDFAKLALIIALARMLTKRQAEIDKALTIESVEQIINKSLWPAILWCSAICGLIALTNFSTAVMLFVTCLLLMYIGRVPLKQLGLLCLVGGIAGLTGLALGDRLGTVINRIKKFFFESDIPFQAEQGFIAIWRGGLFGMGPGNGIQKDFLPHPYSDFIYATILEEWGLLFGVLVILLYLALLYRGMKTVVNSQRAFGGLLSAGLCFSIVIQAMINMGVAVGLGPITGQPLPLLSMGGTSLLFTGISLGIILSVSRGDITEEDSLIEEKEKEEEPDYEEEDGEE